MRKDFKMSGPKRYTQADLDQILGRIRSKAVFTIRFLLPLLGTQPATEAGMAGYIEHHLKLDPQPDADGKPTNPEFIACLNRIKSEEVGERDITPEGGEVEEKKVYGVNVMRKSAAGPFLLAHMVKAALKQSASRLGFFSGKKVGAKGDMSEMGEVMAEGESLQVKERPWEIYLRKDGKVAKTYFDTERGSVSTAKGRMSIQYEAEHVEEGATAEFSFHWPARKLTEEDMAQVAAVATSAALGGARSLSHGKFEVVSLTIEAPEKGKSD